MRRLDIMKITILSKLIYWFAIISIKISAQFFEEIDKLTLKFIWKSEVPRIGKIFLKRRKWKDSYYLISRLSTKAIKVIKSIWYWQRKNTYTN